MGQRPVNTREGVTVDSHVNNHRMLILPADLVDTINQNRGDLTQAQFIEFLINGHLEQKLPEQWYATQEDLADLEQDIKGLLRSFLDFSMGLGLDLGRKSDTNDTENALPDKLQDLKAAAEPSRHEKEQRR